VNLCRSLVTDTQTTELMKPAMRSLDHPSVSPETAPVFLSPVGDPWQDAPPAQRLPMESGIVGSVGEQLQRTATRTTYLPADPWNGVDQGQ
jgi:hypothetical protein